MVVVDGIVARKKGEEQVGEKIVVGIVVDRGIDLDLLNSFEVDLEV